ncbi:uncharacterized protein G2W53_017692 [Senna tora]|uniref:Uncharacterized protein n=1 Tax=Senna tora TaxID=362788 RepID=A0A834TPP3_9FABA|nr:uncharacterized protein G2W53_017692 [Senna tora]
MGQGSAPVLARQAKTKSLMWQGSAPVLGFASVVAKNASEDQKPNVVGLRARSCEKSKRRPKA